MATTVQRLVSSCFVLAVAATGLAIPAPAQAQYRQHRAAGQQRAVKVSQTWGQDGWCYVVKGGRRVRTGRYVRTFPNQANPNVFNNFNNARFVPRPGISAALTRQAAANRQLNTATNQLQVLITELNRQTAAARPRAAAGYVPLIAGATIGGGSGTPNPNALTVSSMEADRIRREGSPLVRQQIGQLDAYLAQRQDDNLKVNVFGTHVWR